MAGWDVRKQGVAGGPRLCVYAFAETHTWIQKAADLAGLGTDAIHWIDGKRPMNVNELEVRYGQDINEGYQPFLVVGSAGTVSTCAVDPLPELAAFCQELEAITNHLSITTLRYIPGELRASLGSKATEDYLNRLNQRLLTAIEESSQAFIS